jgi:hypothetical protein
MREPLYSAVDCALHFVCLQDCNYQPRKMRRFEDVSVIMSPPLDQLFALLREKIREQDIHAEYGNFEETDSMKLTDEGITISQQAQGYRTAFANVEYHRGISYFEVRITKMKSESGIMIGVATKQPNCSDYAISDFPCSWGIHNTGQKWWYGDGTTEGDTKYPELRANTTTGIVVDFTDPNNGEIYYIIDGQSQGKVFTGVKAPVSPAVSLLSRFFTVQYVQNAKIRYNAWKTELN